MSGRSWFAVLTDAVYRFALSIMPATKRARQATRTAITRAKLIDGAYSILLAKGSVGFRLAAVSAETGISRGGLLHHYPTKEGLLAAVYENILHEMEQRTRDALQAAADDALLGALVEAARKRFFHESYRVVLDILSSSEAGGAVRRAQAEYYRPAHPHARFEWAERLAATGIDFKDAEVVTQYLWGAVKGAAIRAMVREDKEYNDRAIALSLELAEDWCRELRAGHQGPNSS